MLKASWSVNFIGAKHLEDVFGEKLTKGSATPPDSQVKSFVARIQNLTIFHSHSNGHFPTTCSMRKTKWAQVPTKPLWKWSSACSNSVRWKSASAFVRVIPTWRVWNLKYDSNLWFVLWSSLIPNQCEDKQRDISRTWEFLDDSTAMLVYFWISVSHWQMNIPEDNLSILQGLCPKSKPAIASAERGYHGKVFWYLCINKIATEYGNFGTAFGYLKSEFFDGLKAKNLLMAMRLQKRSSWKVGCVCDSSSNIIKAAATLCMANWDKKVNWGESEQLHKFKFADQILWPTAVTLCKANWVKTDLMATLEIVFRMNYVFFLWNLLDFSSSKSKTWRQCLDERR